MFNPLSPEFMADPYAFYRQLRTFAPVFMLELAGFEAWILTRHEEVTTVLRDPRFSAQAVPRDILPDALVQGSIFFLDAPDHTRLRRLLAPAFSTDAIDRLTPRIHARAEHLLDEAGDTFELMSDYAVPLSVSVIAELIGVPPEDAGLLKGWSDDLAPLLDGTLMFANTDKARHSAAAFIDYLRDHIEARRANPAEGLISRLLASEGLTDDELVATCLFTLIAGHETTANLIGNGTLALLTHPEQWALLRRQPELMPQAIHELLRYDSPAQLTTRIAREDLTLAGQHIRAGQPVCAVLGAANRDPARFDDPDTLDILRPETRHLAFGHGAHHCIGARLARLEAGIALGLLMQRHPSLAIQSSGVIRRPGVVLRGFASCPLEAFDAVDEAFGDLGVVAVL